MTQTTQTDPALRWLDEQQGMAVASTPPSGRDPSLDYLDWYQSGIKNMQDGIPDAHFLGPWEARWRSVVRDGLLGSLEVFSRAGEAVSTALGASPSGKLSGTAGPILGPAEVKLNQVLYYGIARPSVAVADWLKSMRESDALIADPRAAIEGTGWSSVGEAIKNPQWWTNTFPGMATNAISNIIPGLGAAKIAKVFKATSAVQKALGVSVSSAFMFAQETGGSFDSLWRDLVASGVPEEEAKAFAARGSVMYGMVSALIERGILPYQLGYKGAPMAGLRGFLLKVAGGGVGELTEEEAQMLVEGLMRYTIAGAMGTEVETGITPMAAFQAATAFAPGAALTAATYRAPRASAAEEAAPATQPQMMLTPFELEQSIQSVRDILADENLTDDQRAKAEQLLTDIQQEDFDASEILSNEGQVQEAGIVDEGREDESGPDLQRDQEERGVEPAPQEEVLTPSALKKYLENPAAVTPSELQELRQASENRINAAEQEAERLRQDLRLEQRIRNILIKPKIQQLQSRVHRLVKLTKEQSERAATKAAQATAQIVRAQVKAEERQKAMSIRDIQAKLIKTVRAVVPKSGQGALITTIQNARTQHSFEKALEKIEFHAARENFRIQVGLMKQAMKRAGKRKLTRAQRASLARLIEYGRLLAFAGEGVRRKVYSTTEEYNQYATAIEAVHNAVRSRLAEYGQQKREFQANRKATARSHIQEAIRNILRDTSLEGDDAIYEDREVTGLVRWFRGHLDIDSLTRKVERLWDGSGVLHQLMSVLPKRAEEAKYHELSQIWDWLDARIRQVTFRGTKFQGLSHMLAVMGGTLGESMMERVDVTIGDRVISMPAGEVMTLLAYDEETLAEIASGTQIQSQRAVQRAPLAITIDEIEAIRAMPEFAEMRLLIDDMKGIFEELAPKAFDVRERLTGTAPDLRPGYFPRERNVKARSDITPPDPKDLSQFRRQLVVRMLENAEMFKERKSDINTPFVVRDFLHVFLRHVESQLSVIHQAELISDTASVISDHSLVQAINTKYGSRMNEMLQNHLIIQSGANTSPGSKVDAFMRWMNNNLVGSFLTLNEGTFIRQLGGLAKLWAYMPAATFMKGIQHLQHGTWKKMLHGSGSAWFRYHGSSFSRYSYIRSGSDVGALDSGNSWWFDMRMSLKALVGSIRARDAAGLKNSWERFTRSIKLLDWFDGIVYRVAWEGYEADVREAHPDWANEQVRKEVAILAGDAIRSTQNSSSPNDATTIAIEHRDNVFWRSALLFTTDPLKSCNMMVQALHQGPKKAAKVGVGICINILWSAGASLGTRMWPVGLALLLKGGDDERRRHEALEDEMNRMYWKTAREALSLLYFGDKVIELVEAGSHVYMRGQLASTPIQDTISNFGTGISDLASAIDALSEGDADKFNKRLLRGLAEVAESSSTLVGNPLLMPYYRGRRIAKELAEEERTSSKRKRKVVF